MPQRRVLAQPRNPLFAKVCARILKGFCKGLFGLMLLVVMLSVFGLQWQAEMLWNDLAPWIGRSAVTIGCILAVNSLSEAL
jgi:hypothetical protein